MRIALFGGTFNPIHIGHLRVAEEVRHFCKIDKVLFIPSGNPPLKSHDVAPATDRLKMVAMSVAQNPFFEVSDIELHKQTLTFTIDTIKQMRSQLPNERLFFVCGVDAFLDLPNWKAPEEILQSIEFIVVNRPGYKLASSKYIADLSDKDLTAPLTQAKLHNGNFINVLTVSHYCHSSSYIRHCIKSGISVRYLVHDEVLRYIEEHNLYK